MAFAGLRRLRGWRWGITQLLVLLVLVSLGPFILLEGYRGVEDVHRRRETVSDRARGQAQEKAAAISDYVRFTARYLATLAADPAVQSRDLPRVEALFQAVRELNPNYHNVFLLDRDGTQVASTVPFVADPSITERSYFQEALTTGQLAISGALAWQDSDRSVVVFASPVRDPAGQVTGLLCIALNLARLSSVIGPVTLPVGSMVAIVQRDGTVIGASPTPETWVGQRLGNLPDLDLSRVRARGLTAGAMSDGVERVVAYEPLPGTRWLLVTGIPQAEVDAEFQRSLVRVSQQTLLAVLATVLLAWIVLRRVVMPIRMLSGGARAFAAGALHQRIPLRRRDELGELADAFNGMAATLERRLAEEVAHAQALRELNQLQMEFVATASHELRTPVAALHTYAEALMRPDIDDEDTRRECIEGIERTTARLTRLVRTLLDVSRIDSGRMIVAQDTVSALAIVQAAIAQIAADNGGHTIRLDASPELPLITADAERLEDVLTNLLSNARKFSAPGAPVTVSVTQVGAEVVIAVQDRGIGIAAEEIPRIFDRFYQVQRGTDHRSGGAGLGLYIARAYVLAMGGRIWVASTPGAGSAFFVALPATAGIAAQHLPEPHEEWPHASVARAPAGR